MPETEGACLLAKRMKPNVNHMYRPGASNIVAKVAQRMQQNMLAP